jgi:hypothetical protein
LGPELRRSFEVGINLDVLTDTVGVAKSRRIRSGGHRSFPADAAARLSDYEVGHSDSWLQSLTKRYRGRSIS